MDSCNVVGVVCGIECLDEFVIYIVYWDYLGICFGVGEDGIFNGVVDNVMGMVVILEIGEFFVVNLLECLVMFLVVIVEEFGLLGFVYYGVNLIELFL